jgi:hypothetical protein
MLPAITAIIFSGSLFAYGLSDYTIRIDGDYEITHFNNIQIELWRGDSRPIISTSDYADVGPIVQYAVTKTHIFTRHAGRRPAQRFPGDTFEEVDDFREFFFIVTKSNDSVIGPLSDAQFHAAPPVTRAGEVRWRDPNAVSRGELKSEFLPIAAVGSGILAATVGLVGVTIAVAREWSIARRAR